MEDKEVNENTTNNRVVDPVLVGKFIAELRTKHNLTQQQLGDKIFISRKSISKWENGNGLPSIDLLLPLSDILNVSLEELLEGKFLNKNVEAKSGIADKVLKSPKFRLSVVIGSMLMLFLILCFLIYHLNETTLFSINYEDDNFTITKGTLSFSNSECEISLGDFRANLSKDYRFMYELYTENDDSTINSIAFFNNPNTIYIDPKICKNLKESMEGDNLRTLHLKISFIDNVGEENYYKLDLSNSIKRKSTLKNSMVAYNENNYFEEKDFNDKANHNAVIDEENRSLDAINVKFVFNSNPNDLKKALDDKEYNLGTVMYKAKVDLNVNALEIYFNNGFLNFNFSVNRISYKNNNILKGFTIDENYNVQFNDTNIIYYVLIKNNVEKLKELYDSH